MKLSTDLRICLISCPGAHFSCFEPKIYLKIKLFDCLAVSSKLKPRFPLIFFEHFYFEKQFKCETTLEMFDSLSEESIEIELINENDWILCRYQSNAMKFLYPKPQLRPNYSHSCRSLLMDCILWPISPKLEFQTNNRITEEKEFNSDDDINSSIFGPIEPEF